MPKASTGTKHVALADVVAVDADLFGEDVHDALDGEMGLVGAEAAHRAARGIIREDGFGLDIDVGHAVWAAGVAGGAQQALAARAGIAAGIADDSCAHSLQTAVLVRADRILQGHRMALGMKLRGLFAREHRLHGASQQISARAPFAPEWKALPWRRRLRR